jgi:hypothetical protein
MAAFAVAVPAAHAAGSPGDPTIVLGIGDDAAGGTHDVTFERVYGGTTPNGTPVYIYVPQGGLNDPSVPFMNPNYDPTQDEFTPCGGDVEDYRITQAQVDKLGDELANHIVQVDTEHFGPIGRADETDPASDALVVIAYNLLDDAYYNCDADQYTVGYFAPQYIDEDGMNVIAIDTGFWDELVGHPDSTDLTMEGVIAHELEHLLHNYSDPGELSWVDEGLADFAIFLNGYPTGGSHLTYHQVFHRETSLTRWGGGLENYGASFSFFQYVWEQAGGNGGGDLSPDGANDGTNGDRLIQLIFENEGDGMAGVQNAIDAYNGSLKPGETAVRSAKTLFEDWAVAIYLDDEDSSRWDINEFDFGDPATTSWTISLANGSFYGGRDVYTGAVPPAKYSNRRKRELAGAPTALPFSTSYQSYRNPGSTFGVTLDGEDTTQIAPHTGDTHWYGGYESQNDAKLVAPAAPGTVDFWSWYFIEEGWDYGFVEAFVDGEWQPIELRNDAGDVVTTDDDPHGNNTEGDGLTGTSGGEYFVDEPQYVHLIGTLPAGTTQVRFRYSTDAAYLDTGWFVDDVRVNGAAASLDSEEDWFETTGAQDNNWVLQVISPCDLTPGRVSTGEITDDAGNYVYRLEGDLIRESGFSSKCLGGRGRVTTVISNMPTGDLQFLDAGYTYSLRK